MIVLDKDNTKYVIATFTSAVKKLNILVADKTKNLLQEVIDEGKPNLILNLENITYIDSSGFGAIVSLFNYAKNRDVNFILCHVSDKNMALVKVTKLNEVLTIFDDVNEAVKSI